MKQQNQENPDTIERIENADGTCSKSANSNKGNKTNIIKGSVAIVVLILVLCSVFSGNGNTNRPNGTYKDQFGIIEYTFTDTDFFFTMVDTSDRGAFSFDENVLIVTFDNVTFYRYEYDPQADAFSDGTLIFTKKK